MDHNPFISRNNDLFIMLIAGVSIRLVTKYVFPFSLQDQFLIILMFSFFSGLFMNYLYQSLEWALFFLMGVQIVALAPYLANYIINGDLILLSLIKHSLVVGHYSLFLLSSWIIGIPSGFIVQKLFMANYYRRDLY